MLQQRRNAYRSAIALVVGLGLIVGGSLLPLVSVNGPEVSVFNVTLTPGVEADAGAGELVIWGSCEPIVICAVLLLATRRRGLGIIWRIVTLGAVIGPAVIAYTSWYAVGHPEDLLSSDTFSLSHALAKALAQGKIIEGEPGLGLWFLSAGCLLVAVGCLLPAIKSSRLIIEDTDPRYATILNQGFFAGRSTAQPTADQPAHWQYG